MKKITALIVMCSMLGVVVAPALMAAPVAAVDIPLNLTLVYPEKLFTEKKVRYNVTADAYVSLSNPNSNYGAAGYLWIGDNPYQTRSYLKFNITKPTFSYVGIKSLDLYMYYTGQSMLSYNGVSKVGYMRTSWSESNITWNNAPTDYDIIPNVLYHPGAAIGVFVHFSEMYGKNFTQYICKQINQDWKKWSNSTFSLVLMKDHAIGGSYMGEKTYMSDETSPKAYIVVTYQIYPKVYYYKYSITPTADAYVDERHPTWKYGHNESLLVGYAERKYQKAYIFFQNDAFLNQIGTMFPDYKMIAYDILLYARNTVQPTYVLAINRTYFTTINEDTLCWNTRPSMGTTQAITDITLIDSEWHFAASDVFSDAMKYQMETFGAVLISLYVNVAMDAVEYASREYLNPVTTTPLLQMVFTSSVQIFEEPKPKPEPIDFSDVNIGYITSVGFWLFGLLGMFATIPLVVYRIKNGDEEIYAVAIGLVVFIISMGLFLAGGAPL